MSPEAACDQQTFYDTPFVNELYLLVLLFIWHKIEKEIVNIAALSAERDDSPISRDDYRNEVVRLAKLRHEKRKKELGELLPLDQHDWALLDLLRLLANSYKHDPFDKPSKNLLKRLRIDAKTTRHL
jgi:hypothetical protein